MLLSHVWPGAITGQAVINGRLVTEFRQCEFHGAGTLVNEPCTNDAGLDVTCTRQGLRVWDCGVFTPR